MYWDNETFYKEIPTINYNGQKYECSNNFVTLSDVDEHRDNVYFEDFTDFSGVGYIFNIYGIDESEFIALFIADRSDFEQCIVYRSVAN